MCVYVPGLALKIQCSPASTGKRWLLLFIFSLLLEHLLTLRSPFKYIVKDLYLETGWTNSYIYTLSQVLIYLVFYIMIYSVIIKSIQSSVSDDPRKCI